MRIISGAHRGRILKRVNKPTTRETSDMVRESVFNIVRDIQGLTVLDLFAGSGSYGLEALSRGALSATFIDHDKDAIACIRLNVELLSYQRQSTIILANDKAFLSRKGSSLMSFDLAFVDPPYDISDHERILSELSFLIRPSGTVVIETSKKTDMPEAVGTLILRLTRTYGNKRITIYSQESAT